jgi:hypothetical protein
MAPAGTPAKRSLAKAAPSKEDAQEDIDDEDDDDDTLKKVNRLSLHIWLILFPCLVELSRHCH